LPLNIFASHDPVQALDLVNSCEIHLTLLCHYYINFDYAHGYFQQDNIRKNKERLSLWLDEQGLETEGDFIVAGYNPPWIPGFMARNEVLIQIKSGMQ
jgi:hypothetical protein